MKFQLQHMLVSHIWAQTSQFNDSKPGFVTITKTFKIDVPDILFSQEKVLVQTKSQNLLFLKMRKPLLSLVSARVAMIITPSCCLLWLDSLE